MDISARIRDLERLHRDLDNRITVLEAQPGADNTAITEMKRQKLAYRDELSRLRRQQYEENQRVGYGEE
jgi:hypothetical protein